MQTDKYMLYSGYGWALLSAVLWSTIGPMSKFCQQEGIPPLDIAFWRALLGGICFALQVLFLRQWRVPIIHAIFFMFFGVLGVGAFFALLQVAIVKSGAAVSMVLMYTAPIWVAFFARIFFYEPITRYKLIGITIALLGTGMVCMAGGSLPNVISIIGLICGIASGFCYALHFPFFVWWKNRYSTAVIYTYMLLGGVFALLPFVSGGGNYTLMSWLNILGLGIITNYFAYYAYGQCLRCISQVSAAVIGNVEPLLATFWLWQFWGENFTPLGWVGSACILIAVLCITLEPGKV